MKNNLQVKFNSFILHILPLILGILTLTSSLPAYSNEDYPEALPMNYMGFQLEVDIPKNEIEDIDIPRHNYDKKNHHTTVNSNKCCAEVPEIIEPVAGKNRSGDLVELYQVGRKRQRFYEISCSEEAADQECKFLHPKHKANSKCVQQYSYTYALVKDFGSKENNYRLDYIMVRSGCSCHVSSSSSPSDAAAD